MNDTRKALGLSGLPLKKKLSIYYDNIKKLSISSVFILKFFYKSHLKFK